MIQIWRRGLSGGRFPVPEIFLHRTSGYGMWWKDLKMMTLRFFFNSIQIFSKGNKRPFRFSLECSYMITATVENCTNQGDYLDEQIALDKEMEDTIYERKQIVIKRSEAGAILGDCYSDFFPADIFPKSFYGQDEPDKAVANLI
ncbi:hypothetical protein [Blautia sp. An249]|uniref:hypothetical protein n=1 Tax=Blautia sp. An249 TaxID=1965603 RepID=UPI001FA8F6DF|nr:hypothetical protein [Blautia sp. An249]